MPPDFFPYLTAMSNNASGEILTLLPKKLSDMLGNKVHDVLLTLWLGNLELLQQLEELALQNKSVPWLNCGHWEFRNALICLMSIGVLLSLYSIATCWTSDRINNQYRSMHENTKLVLSEAAVTSDQICHVSYLYSLWFYFFYSNILTSPHSQSEGSQCHQSCTTYLHTISCHLLEAAFVSLFDWIPWDLWHIHTALHYLFDCWIMHYSNYVYHSHWLLVSAAQTQVRIKMTFILDNRELLSNHTSCCYGYSIYISYITYPIVPTQTFVIKSPSLYLFLTYPFRSCFTINSKKPFFYLLAFFRYFRVKGSTPSDL